MDTHTPLEVKVWGEIACFTRPEMKVERVSYEAMTPSAARGVLEAIFWKPEFRWLIQEIHVLRPIEAISFLRNEVKNRASYRAAQSWIDTPGAGFFVEDDRTQRHTLALRDVAYVIHADIELIGRGTEEHPAKYRDQFRRRVAKGQCFHRPYLGCREFTASFSEASDQELPIDVSKHLGRMLFDLKYMPDGSGEGTPIFFDAELDQGILKVPQPLYQQTLPGGSP